MVRSLPTLLSLTLLAPAALAASADDWKSRSIYQVCPSLLALNKDRLYFFVSL